MSGLIGIVLGSTIALSALVVFLNTLKNSNDLKMGSKKAGALNLILASVESLFIILILTPLALLMVFYHIVSHMVTHWKYYLALFLLVAVIVVWAQYNHEIIVAYDKQNTLLFRPLMRNVLWPISNLIRISFDIIICWWNAMWYLYVSSISITFKIVLHCEADNFQNQAEKALAVIESPFLALANFMIAGGGDDADINSIVEAVTDFTFTFKPVFNCICDDLSFTTDITLDTLNSPYTALTVDRYLNGMFIILPRIFIGGLIEVLQTGTPSPSGCSGRECKLERMPKFTEFTQAFCDFGYYLGLWIDTLTENIYDQFFDNDDVIVPPVGKQISAPICIYTEIFSIFLDLLWHIDLIFDGSTNYLKYTDLTGPQHAALNLTAGLEEFFQSFDAQITDDLGCILRDGGDVLIYSYNFTALLTQRVISSLSNPASIKHFVLVEYDYDLITDSWTSFINCTVEFFHDINEPLGDIVKYALGTLGAMCTNFVKLMGQFGSFLSYMSSQFLVDAQRVFDNMDSFAVACGNFWRQFSSSPCEDFDVTTPDTARANLVINLYAYNQNFFCCLGTTVHAITQMIVDLIKMTFIFAIRISFNILEIADVVDEQITFMNDWIEGTSCALASPFTQDCLGGAENQFRDSIGNILITTLNTTSIPIRMIVVGLRILDIMVNDPNLSADDANAIFCAMTLGMYDMTFGSAFDILRHITLLCDCFFGDIGIGDFGTDLWDIFGWDNDSNTNFRYIVCNFSAALVQMFSGFMSFITELQGGFFSVISYLRCVVFQFSPFANLFSDPPTFCFGLDIIVDADAPFFHLNIDFGDDVCNNNWTWVVSLPDFLDIVDEFFEIFGNIMHSAFTNTCGNCYGDAFNSACDKKRNVGIPTETERIERKRFLSEFLKGSYSVNMRDILQNNTETKCAEGYKAYISGELDGIPWQKELVESQLWQCTYSQVLSRIINDKLAGVAHMNTSAPSARLLGGDAFYDVRSSLNSTATVARVMAPMASFMFMPTYSAMTWDQFTYYKLHTELVILDKYTLQFGSIWKGQLDRWKFDNRFMTGFNMLKGFLSQVQTRMTPSENTLFVMSTAKTFGYDVWHKKNGLLSHFYGKKKPKHKKPKNPFNNNNNKRGFSESDDTFMQPPRRNDGKHSTIKDKEKDIDPWYRSDFKHPIFPVIQKGKDKFNRAYGDVTGWFNRVTRVGTPKAQKNRDSITNAWMSLIHVYRTRGRDNTIQDPILSPSCRGGVKNKPNNPSTTKQSSSKIESSAIIAEGTTICGANGENCLDCALAKQLFNNFAFVLFDCIKVASGGINVNVTHNHPPQHITVSNGGGGTTRNVTFEQPLGMSGDLMRFWHWLLKDVMDVDTTANELTRFATATPDGSTSNNPYYWLYFMETCRYESLECNTNIRPGYGLVNGLLFGLLFLIMGSILAAFFLPPASSAMNGLWVCYPAIVLVIGYYWSPWCMLAVPRCIADDAHELFTSLNPYCTEWSVLLPGINAGTCSTDFINCANSPYDMRTTERTLFTFMEMYSPVINDYLRTTHMGVFSWIRDSYSDSISFPFPYGQVPDAYRSCAHLNSGQLLIASFFMIAAVVLVCLLAYPFIILYVALLKFISLVIAMFILAVSTYYGGPPPPTADEKAAAPVGTPKDSTKTTKSSSSSLFNFKNIKKVLNSKKSGSTSLSNNSINTFSKKQDRKREVFKKLANLHAKYINKSTEAKSPDFIYLKED